MRTISTLNLSPDQQQIEDHHRAEDWKRLDASSLTSLPSPYSDYIDPFAEEQLGGEQALKPSQTILNGTTLRDTVLRAFQEDFLPYASLSTTMNITSSESPNDGAMGTSNPPLEHEIADVRFEQSSRSENIVEDDGIVQPTHNLQPTDIDAIPVPAHLQAQTKSILADNQEIVSWTKRYLREAPVVRSEGDPEIPLNPSQIRAIAMMLSERLSLVQGVGLPIMIRRRFQADPLVASRNGEDASHH